MVSRFVKALHSVSFGLVVLVPALAAAGPRCTPDNWAAPVIREVFSESREWFVRVVPGRVVLPSAEDTEARSSPAKAEWFRRLPNRSYEFLHEVELPHRVAPVDIFVTDRGYLVTLDNWGEKGAGIVLASHGPDGVPVATFRLDQLFSRSEIAAFPRTVSSTWWRRAPTYVRTGQQSIYVSLGASGEELIYEPETGAWQICERRNGEPLCRTSNDARDWRAYREPELQR